MSIRSRFAGLVCAVLLSALPLAFASGGTTKKQSTAPKQEIAPAAVPPAPVISQPPPTPEEMPATPPKVTLSGGRLSIVADNSTLGDVLSAVKSLTHATVDAPNSATAERVAVNLGPGQPQDVLQQLFAGSRFDYIILGSPDNAAAIQKIILTAKSSGGGGNGGNQPIPPPRNGSQPPGNPDGDNGVDDEISQPEPPPQPEEVTPPPQAAQPGQVGPDGQPPAENNQPKSPEQLLQELQRMQQQQRPQRGPTPN